MGLESVPVAARLGPRCLAKTWEHVCSFLSRCIVKHNRGYLHLIKAWWQWDAPYSVDILDFWELPMVPKLVPSTDQFVFTLFPHIPLLYHPSYLSGDQYLSSDRQQTNLLSVQYYRHKWLILLSAHNSIIYNVHFLPSTAATTHIPASQTWILREPGSEVTRGRTSWWLSWMTASREPTLIWCKTM